jgi:glycosyltransferase involved in cell wall biosynthesis
MGDTRIISVLTPALRPKADWLRRAHESLHEQDLSSHFWEWCLQVDGTQELVEDIPESVLADPAVRVEANGLHLTTALTRNYALARSRGAYVRNLDGDDWLLPGALEAEVSVLEADPEVAYVTGEALIHKDGLLQENGAPSPFPAGRLEAGAVDGLWRQGQHFGLVFNTVMFRRSHLLAYGGWAGLTRWEDVALMMPVAAEHPTHRLGQATTVYRQHDQQAIRSEATERLRAANMSFTKERVAALRALRGEPDDSPEPVLTPPYAQMISR